VIAGEGDAQFVAGLRRLAEELGIADRILWAGFLSGDDKVSAMSAASLFVLPSYSENFGIALVEAMAAGLPCVISDQVGIAVDAKEYDAGMVTTCEVAPIASAIRLLLEDLELRTWLGENARRLVEERFSVEAMSDSLVSFTPMFFKASSQVRRVSVPPLDARGGVNKKRDLRVSGQDGAYLAQLLLAKGYQVFGTSRDAQVASFNNLVRLGIFEQVALDSVSLTDFRSVLQALMKIQPDEVYNLAGQSSVGLSFQKPVETLESIAQGTLNLLRAIRFTDRPSGACRLKRVLGDTDLTDETTPFIRAVPMPLKGHTFWKWQAIVGPTDCLRAPAYSIKSPLRRRFVQENRQHLAASPRVNKSAFSSVILQFSATGDGR
jgi:hypothetical protein